MKAFPLAFPLVSKEPYQYDWGMDLRDYFAAKAMQADISNVQFNDSNFSLEHWSIEEIAQRAYRMADAMMKEREQK